MKPIEHSAAWSNGGDVAVLALEGLIVTRQSTRESVFALVGEPHAANQIIAEDGTVTWEEWVWVWDAPKGIPDFVVLVEFDSNGRVSDVDGIVKAWFSLPQLSIPQRAPVDSVEKIRYQTW